MAGTVTYTTQDFGYSPVAAVEVDASAQSQSAPTQDGNGGDSSSSPILAGAGRSANAGAAAAAAAAAKDMDDTEVPVPLKDFVPFTDVVYPRGSDNYDALDADSQMQSMLAACGCCCCMAILVTVAGSFLLAYDKYRDTSTVEKVGAGVLALGVLMLLLAVCACCGACLFACSKGAKLDGRGGSKDWSIKRLNDSHSSEMNTFDDLRFPVGTDSQAMRKKRTEEKEAGAQLKKAKKSVTEAAIAADIERGLSSRAVQNARRPVVFKVVFHGDIYVSSIDVLRDQISLCLELGCKRDTVCVLVTSGGGAVTMYGLAAAQLARVRKKGLRLVVSVDSIAASGGYLMATMADTIVASPFALVGSIGVIAMVPNVQKLLEKHDINTYVFTAGKYKRTVDVIGDVTEEGKAKLMEELEEIHRVFKVSCVLFCLCLLCLLFASSLAILSIDACMHAHAVLARRF